MKSIFWSRTTIHDRPLVKLIFVKADREYYCTIERVTVCHEPSTYKNLVRTLYIRMYLARTIEIHSKIASAAQYVLSIFFLMILFLPLSLPVEHIFTSRLCL